MTPKTIMTTRRQTHAQLAVGDRYLNATGMEDLFHTHTYTSKICNRSPVFDNHSVYARDLWF